MRKKERFEGDENAMLNEGRPTLEVWHREWVASSHRVAADKTSIARYSLQCCFDTAMPNIDQVA